MYGKEVIDKIWGPRGWVSIGHQYVDEAKRNFVLTLNGRPHAVGEHWGSHWTILINDAIIDVKTMSDLKSQVAKL